MAKPGTPIVPKTDLATSGKDYSFYDGTDAGKKGFLTTATWGANPIYHCAVAEATASNVKGAETLVE